MVSSVTCEPCDVDLKRQKGPYSMPLFAAFVFENTGNTLFIE